MLRQRLVFVDPPDLDVTLRERPRSVSMRTLRWWCFGVQCVSLQSYAAADNSFVATICLSHCFSPYATVGWR